MTVFTATASVPTDRPARYAKQLASHFGNKVQVDEIEGGFRIHFGRDGDEIGTGDVLPREHALELIARAEDEARLERVRDVLANHLVRFGERDNLRVEWNSL